MNDILSFIARKGVRLYFNRHGAAPLVWCVADKGGAYEVAVSGFSVINGVDIRTVYAPKETPDHEDGKPSAWLETLGPVRVTLTSCGLLPGPAYLEPVTLSEMFP